MYVRYNQKPQAISPPASLDISRLYFPCASWTRQVEVKLVGVHFGQEVTAAGEVLQIKELVFFESVHGFHVALIGVRGRRDAHMLAVAESFGEITLELAAIVALPDQVAQRNPAAIEVLLNAQAKTALAEALRSCAKAQKSSPLRISRAVYSMMRKCNHCACRQ